MSYFNKLISFSQFKWSTVKILAAGLVMPSVLLPIKYSSILLIIISLIIILNFLINKERKIPKLFFYPFLVYYASIIISFIIDVFNGIIDFDFLLRNIIILIIPFFIFTSNFTRPQVLKILKLTSVIISLAGIIIIIFWITGYNRYSNYQEFQKEEWLKNEISTNENFSKKGSLFELKIHQSSKTPTLHKVGTLSNWNKKDSIVRELIVKGQSSKSDIWIFIRSFDDGSNKGAWFNAKNGQIGFVQEGMKAKTKVLPNNYFKFTLKNKPKENATKEWFNITFVSGNGQYQWNNNSGDENVKIQLKPPKFHIDSGEDLLKPYSLLSYKLTKFSTLENFAHGTYMALVFVFALVMLIFNSFLRNSVRYLFILINIFVIYALASKAVIISLLIIFPVYYFKQLVSYKFIVLAFITAIVLSFNGYVKERFVDMYQTIIKINNEEALGDLVSLSTNQRINIYKDFYYLIKKNYIIGYGNTNGKKVVNSLFNHDFNAHNQYLQTLFNSGLLGLVLFILFCMSPLILKKNAFNNKHGLIFFIAVILFNFLFESLMYRQWGLLIVSFSFAIYFEINKPKFKWFQ